MQTNYIELKPHSLIFFKFLLASDARFFIVDGCDLEEEIDNDILPSTWGNKNTRIEIRESNEDDFVSNDSKDDLDKENKVKLE